MHNNEKRYKSWGSFSCGWKKGPKTFYSILRNRAYVDVENKWTDCLDVLDELDWNDIHRANFNCTIETQLRSFYFKLFHRAICTNQFLHKIGRFDSPNCSFCKKFPKTLLHLFCQCEKVSPLWDDLCILINSISEESFNFSVFETKMFGVRDTSEHDNCISFFFFFFLIFLFMSDAHHGINSSTQKYQSTQSSVVLTSCRQDSGSPPF